MMEKNITELVALVKQGDEIALNEIYNRTIKKAHFVAKYSLKSSDGDYSFQIEDILQDAYMKAFRNLHSLDNPEKLQGWIDTIIINECRNFLKKKKPQLFSDLSAENDTDGKSLEFEDTLENDRVEFNPDASVDYDETKRLIAEMLDRMPAQQKQCLLMYYYEEKSVKDIAADLDCSEGTIKSRLNYARKNLKEQVLELEKKGTKLYCAPLLPFLYWFFHQQAEDYVNTITAAAVGGAAAASTAAGTFRAAESTAAGVGHTAAGAKTAAAVAGKASLGLGIKLTIAAVGAAAVIGGGSIAVKTVFHHTDETVAMTEVTDMTTAEASEAATETVVETKTVAVEISEPEELIECLGLTKDEIKEKFGEPEETTQEEENLFEDSFLRYSDNRSFGFSDDSCNLILCDMKDAFKITKPTDIHDLLDTVKGQVVSYNFWVASGDPDVIDFMSCH